MKKKKTVGSKFKPLRRNKFSQTLNLTARKSGIQFLPLDHKSMRTESKAQRRLRLQMESSPPVLSSPPTPDKPTPQASNYPVAEIAQAVSA